MLVTLLYLQLVRVGESTFSRFGVDTQSDSATPRLISNSLVSSSAVEDEDRTSGSTIS